MKRRLVLLAFLNTDASPTKAFMKELGERDCFGRASFGKRPPVDLFDLAEDRDCVHYPANHEMYASKAGALREKRFTELKGILAVLRIGREMRNPTTFPKSRQGRLSIAQRFIAGNGRAAGLSPAGTAESGGRRSLTAWASFVPDGTCSPPPG